MEADEIAITMAAATADSNHDSRSEDCGVTPNLVVLETVLSR